MYAVCRVAVIVRIVIDAGFGILDTIERYCLAGADTQCRIFGHFLRNS